VTHQKKGTLWSLIQSCFCNLSRTPWSAAPAGCCWENLKGCESEHLNQLPHFLLLVTSFKQTYYLLCWPTYRKRIPTFPTPHIRSLRCDCSRRTPVEARTPTQIRQALPWELAWSQGPHVGGEESTDQAPEEHTATVKIFLNKRPRLWRRLNVAFQVEHCRWGTLFISSRLALTWFRWSPKFFSAVTLLYNPVIPQIYSWEPETWHLELLKFEHDITW